MAINPFGVVGVPGGIGGTTLGLGVVISLHDMFSRQARTVERSMRRMDRSAADFTNRMQLHFGRLQAGLGIMTAGMVTLASLSFPVREAVKFQEAIKRVQVIADNIDNAALEKLAINLANIFPQSPVDMANALKTTVAAGIENVPKAAELLKATNKLAVATQSDLDRSIEGTTSLVNAYRLGLSENISTEQAGVLFERMASQIFEAMKFGKFSDVSDITDFEAMSKQMGQIMPAATGALNMSLPELLALWAASTLGGQNARKAATGLRQSFMDILNRSRNPGQLPAEFVQQMMQNTGFDVSQVGALQDFVAQQGYTALLGQVREFAGITDSSRLRALFKTPRFQEQLADLQASLPEDTTIQEALAGGGMPKEFLESIFTAGGVNAGKVSQIFRSIWGLTAVLPLLTAQWDKLGHIQEKIANSTNSADKAFREVMNTVAMQWQLFTSKLATFNQLLGKQLLDPILNAIKVAIRFVDLLNLLAQTFPVVTEVAMRTAAFTGVFLSAFGGVLALSGAFGGLNLVFKRFLAETLFFSRWARGGILLLLTDTLTIVLLIVSALYVLRKAWESNFLRIRDVTGDWGKKIGLTFQAVTELFRTLGESGTASISEELYQKLQAEGLDKLVGHLFALLYRVREAVRGFVQGFLGFYRMIGKVVGIVTDGVRDLYDLMGPTIERIEWLDRLLKNLFHPTTENIQQWRRWGRVVGVAAGALSLLASASWLFARLARVGAVFASLTGGLTGLWAVLSNPWVLLLLSIAGAAWVFRDRLASAFNWLNTWMQEHMPGLLDWLNKFSNWVVLFPSMVRGMGLAQALDASGFMLFGVRFTDLFQRLRDQMSGLIEKATELFNTWKARALDAYDALVTGAISAKQRLIPILDSIRVYFQDLSVDVLAALRDGFGLDGSLLSELTSLWADIKNIVSNVFDGMQTAWLAFKNNFDWGDHWEVARDVFNNFVTLVGWLFGFLLNGIREVFRLFGTDGSFPWQDFWGTMASFLDLTVGSALQNVNLQLESILGLFNVMKGNQSFGEYYQHMRDLRADYDARTAQRRSDLLAAGGRFVGDLFKDTSPNSGPPSPNILTGWSGAQDPARLLNINPLQPSLDMATPLDFSPPTKAEADLIQQALNDPRFEGELQAYQGENSAGGENITSSEAGLLITLLQDIATGLAKDQSIVVQLDGVTLASALAKRVNRNVQMGVR